MKVGAYTVANSGTMPTAGARHITLTHTSGDTTDTLGTVTVVGTNLSGETISEVLTPSADAAVTGAKWFKTVTSVTGAGWTVDAAEGTPDTLVVGCTAAACVAEGNGELARVIVSETAAGAITFADSTGTLCVLKASVAEMGFEMGFSFTDYLTVTAAAASKVTVVTS